MYSKMSEAQMYSKMCNKELVSCVTDPSTGEGKELMRRLSTQGDVEGLTINDDRLSEFISYYRKMTTRNRVGVSDGKIARFTTLLSLLTELQALRREKAEADNRARARTSDYENANGKCKCGGSWEYDPFTESESNLKCRNCGEEKP